jgi:hypothetical protein
VIAIPTTDRAEMDVAVLQSESRDQVTAAIVALVRRVPWTIRYATNDVG